MAIFSAFSDYRNSVNRGALATKQGLTPVRTTKSERDRETTPTTMIADDLTLPMPSALELRRTPLPPPPSPPPPAAAAAVRKTRRSSLLASSAIRRVKSLVGLNKPINVGLISTESETPKATRRRSTSTTTIENSVQNTWEDDLDVISDVRRHSAPDGGGPGVPARRRNIIVRLSLIHI